MTEDPKEKILAKALKNAVREDINDQDEEPIPARVEPYPVLNKAILLTAKFNEELEELLNGLKYDLEDVNILNLEEFWPLVDEFLTYPCEDMYRQVERALGYHTTPYVFEELIQTLFRYLHKKKRVTVRD